MMAANTKETGNIKIESSSIFGTNDKVGDVGTITDGTYNVQWVIYTISGNTYQLFPLNNLTTHRMNPTDITDGGYENSEMYGFIHNTVLPNLRKSGLNIIACNLVSKDVYVDIVRKVGIPRISIAGGEDFWLTDHDSSNYFYFVGCYGSIFSNNDAGNSFGVRPLITVVK